MELPEFAVECANCHHKTTVKMPQPFMYNGKHLAQLYMVQEPVPCQGCHKVEFRQVIHQILLPQADVLALKLAWVGTPIEHSDLVVTNQMPTSPLIV